MQDNPDHTASDFASDPATHDAWFRRKVYEALADHSADIPDEQVEKEFAKLKKEALATLELR